MKVYHRKSCITCKRTISEMERLKLDIEKRNIYDDPLIESEIRKILQMAKITPRQLLRKKDKMYKELHLDGEHTDAELINYMAQYPGLITRPIIFEKTKLWLARKHLHRSRRRGNNDNFQKPIKSRPSK